MLIGDVLCVLKMTLNKLPSHAAKCFNVSFCGSVMHILMKCSEQLPCCLAWALFSLGSWWDLPESGPAAELSSVPSWQAVCPWFALVLSLGVLGQQWQLPANQLSLPSPTANKEQRRHKRQVGQTVHALILYNNNNASVGQSQKFLYTSKAYETKRDKTHNQQS